VIVVSLLEKCRDEAKVLVATEFTPTFGFAFGLAK
jgi:hypothetical protein